MDDGRLRQVAGNFGLAVNHDRLATGECFHIDTLTTPVDHNLKTVVNFAFLIHSVGDAGFAH